MEVKISVIVPIYNTEKYLRKCLDSLVNQTLKDIEIILINDGSPDNSENIVSEYLERYPDKIVYHKKKNEGQGVARNLGIKMAKGDFVSFVDSDDYVDVTIFEKLYKKAVESGASLVFSEGLIEVRNNHEIQHGIEFDDNDEIDLLLDFDKVFDIELIKEKVGLELVRETRLANGFLRKLYMLKLK